MKDDPRVEVVVVNWNGLPHVRECLRALRLQNYGNFGVVVADNHSDDGSYEEIERDFPEFRTIRLGRNIGFGAAANAAFATVGADYFALLNNDAVPPENWIGALVEEAGKNPRAGMVSCDVIESGDGGGSTSSGFTLSRDGFALLRWETLRDAPLLGPSGAAALYSAPLIERTGGFDEDFFLYYEDADLALRSRLLGWECAHTAKAPVRHLHSASAGNDLPRKRRLLHRNRLEFIARSWPRHLLLTNLHWIAFGEVGALLFLLLRGRVLEFAGALADLAAVAVRLPALRRRLPLQASDTATAPAIWRRSGGAAVARRRIAGKKR